MNEYSDKSLYFEQLLKWILNNLWLIKIRRSF